MTNANRFVILLGLLLLPVAGAAGGFCATSNPESVLSCLSDAYARQDILAYSNLLADDYAYYFGKNPNPWGRDTDLRTAKELFNPDSCKNLSLDIAPGYEVLEGDAKGTWTIKNLAITFKLDSLRPSAPGHFEVVVKGEMIKVRRVSEPNKHFQIYYWWCPEPTNEDAH
jgi:hypothetical protein